VLSVLFCFFRVRLGLFMYGVVDFVILMRFVLMIMKLMFG